MESLRIIREQRRVGIIERLDDGRFLISDCRQVENIAAAGRALGADANWRFGTTLCNNQACPLARSMSLL